MSVVVHDTKCLPRFEALALLFLDCTPQPLLMIAVMGFFKISIYFYAYSANLRTFSFTCVAYFKAKTELVCKVEDFH